MDYERATKMATTTKRRTRTPKPLRTFRFPVTLDGVQIGEVTWNREDGYAAVVGGEVIDTADSKDEAEILVFEAARRLAA